MTSQGEALHVTTRQITNEYMRLVLLVQPLNFPGEPVTKPFEFIQVGNRPGSTHNMTSITMVRIVAYGRVNWRMFRNRFLVENGVAWLRGPHWTTDSGYSVIKYTRLLKRKEPVP